MCCHFSHSCFECHTVHKHWSAVQTVCLCEKDFFFKHAKHLAFPRTWDFLQIEALEPERTFIRSQGHCIQGFWDPSSTLGWLTGFRTTRMSSLRALSSLVRRLCGLFQMSVSCSALFGSKVAVYHTLPTCWYLVKLILFPLCLSQRCHKWLCSRNRLLPSWVGPSYGIYSSRMLAASLLCFGVFRVQNMHRCEQWGSPAIRKRLVVFAAP